MGITEDNVEVYIRNGAAVILAHRKGATLTPEVSFNVSPGMANPSAIVPFRLYVMLTAVSHSGYPAFEQAALNASVGSWFAALDPQTRNDFYTYFSARVGETKFRLHRGNQGVDIESDYLIGYKTGQLFDYALGPLFNFDGYAAANFGAVWNDAAMTQARKEAFRGVYEMLR